MCYYNKTNDKFAIQLNQKTFYEIHNLTDFYSGEWHKNLRHGIGEMRYNQTKKDPEKGKWVRGKFKNK